VDRGAAKIPFAREPVERVLVSIPDSGIQIPDLGQKNIPDAGGAGCPGPIRAGSFEG